MTWIRLFWLILALCWVLIEVAIIRSSRRRAQATQKHEQRSEKFIWVIVCLSLVFAVILKELQLWPMPIAYINRQGVAVLLFLGGVGLRFYAVFSLGRFFTTRVGIHHAHRLIQSGPYRYIRHPSYTGLIVAFIGAGIAMGDFAALMILLIPVVGVLLKRIGIEEICLLDHFGHEYTCYCSRTKKLIPYLY